MVNEKLALIDSVEYRKVLPDGTLDMSPEGLILKTNNHPSLWQRIQMFLGRNLEHIFGPQAMVKVGLYKCAGDAMMNFGLQHLATAIHDYYGYVSVGTSSTLPDDYTLTNLVSPVLTRVLAVKGYDTTYIENDTAVFTAVFTPNGAYTIVETGLHTTLSGTTGMGARQTSCSIATVSGVPFGIIWRVCVARG